MRTRLLTMLAALALSATLGQYAALPSQGLVDTLAMGTAVDVSAHGASL